MTRLTPEQQARVKENLGLVGAFIRRYPPPRRISIEDYHQDLTIGLCVASATWNPEKGAVFSTWAFHRFMGVRAVVLRSYSKRQVERQPHEEIGFSSTPARDERPPEKTLSSEQAEFVRRVFFSLSIDEQDMLIGKLTTRQIGARIGISHQAVQGRKDKLIRVLRGKMAVVFPHDWRREEGFFRRVFDLPGTKTDTIMVEDET